MPDEALAYVYCGGWVAECPASCGNVQAVSRDEASVYRCVYCQQLSAISWPAEEAMEEMMAVMNRRPNPSNRNWYPQDHPVAVRFGVPHGQSIQDLLEENLEHGIL